MQRIAEPEFMDLPEEAQAYAAADFAEVNAAFVARLLELAGDEDGLATVDLGTGPADIALRLLCQRPRWQVTAVDAAAAMLELARAAAQQAGLGARLQLVEADACRSGLPAASFDVVFSNSLLHHVAEADRLWAEVRRLLKPGGLVFLRDLLRPDSEAQVQALVAEHAGGESALLQQEFLRSLRAAYTLDEVRAQLARQGLAQLSVAAVSDRHLDVWGRVDNGG